MLGQFDRQTGKSNGIVRMISEHGDLLSEMVMFSGVKTGLCRLIDQHGSVSFAVHDEDGKVIAKEFFNKFGEKQ